MSSVCDDECVCRLECVMSRVCDVESVCGECVKWVCVEWEKGVGVCEMTQEREAKFGTREL